MNETDLNEDDIFIAEVKGTSGTTKTISIPIEFCKFCKISDGDLVKLKLLCKRNSSEKKKNGK